MLKELQVVGITGNPKKCAMGKQETKYLEFVVRQGVIKPLASKVKAICEFSLPHTKCYMRSFLGLANYYIHFVPHFVELAALCLTPLRSE